MSSDRWFSVKQKIQSLLDRLQRLEAENDELHQKINQYESALETQNESQEPTNHEPIVQTPFLVTNIQTMNRSLYPTCAYVTGGSAHVNEK